MTNWIIFNDIRIRKDSITAYGKCGDNMVYIHTSPMGFNKDFNSKEEAEDYLSWLDRRMKLND